MSDLTLVPTNSLTIASSTPPPPGVTNTPAERFILFGNEWLDMQNYISRALQLPINMGDFTTKYGDFSSTDQKMVQNVLDAMKKVQGLSTTFGDPVTIRNEIMTNGSFLSGNTPPSALYAHIVWLANQIENASSTFSFTFGSLNDIIGPNAGSPEDRANNLKQLLVGNGGLASTAEDMQKKTATLRQALATFDGQMSDANTQMLLYTGQESQIMQDVSQILGQLNADANELQQNANEAYDEWRKFTIAAVVASVLIAVLSCGILLPVAAIVGGGLGIKAGLERAKYNALMDQLRQKEVEIGKKTRLQTDLTGLNTAIGPITGVMSDFLANLQQIEGVWTDIGMNLSYISTNYNVDQLSDLNFVMQKFKILDAQNKWQAISDTASQFTQNSLVQYSTNVSFGQNAA